MKRKLLLLVLVFIIIVCIFNSNIEYFDNTTTATTPAVTTAPDPRNVLGDMYPGPDGKLILFPGDDGGKYDYSVYNENKSIDEMFRQFGLYLKQNVDLLHFSYKDTSYQWSIHNDSSRLLDYFYYLMPLKAWVYEENKNPRVEVMWNNFLYDHPFFGIIKIMRHHFIRASIKRNIIIPSAAVVADYKYIISIMKKINHTFTIPPDIIYKEPLQNWMKEYRSPTQKLMEKYIQLPDDHRDGSYDYDFIPRKAIDGSDTKLDSYYFIMSNIIVIINNIADQIKRYHSEYGKNLYNKTYKASEYYKKRESDYYSDIWFYEGINFAGTTFKNIMDEGLNFYIKWYDISYNKYSDAGGTIPILGGRDEAVGLNYSSSDIDRKMDIFNNKINVNNIPDHVRKYLTNDGFNYRSTEPPTISYFINKGYDMSMAEEEVEAYMLYFPFNSNSFVSVSESGVAVYNRGYSWMKITDDIISDIHPIWGLFYNEKNIKSLDDFNTLLKKYKSDSKISPIEELLTKNFDSVLTMILRKNIGEKLYNNKTDINTGKKVSISFTPNYLTVIPAYDILYKNRRVQFFYVDYSEGLRIYIVYINSDNFKGYKTLLNATKEKLLEYMETPPDWPYKDWPEESEKKEDPNAHYKFDNGNFAAFKTVGDRKLNFWPYF